MIENESEPQIVDVQDAAPVAPDMGTFADLGLRPEILQSLQEMGFTAPMDVQRQTAPVVKSGKDVLVQSRTGSGKTAAFGIPLLDSLVTPEDRHVQAIVMLPTRELALQVAAELARISAHLDITVVPVYGGAPMGRQVEQLRAGGQVVCGTPGRILDHLRRGTLKLDRVRCAVLDECDEMLSMGFQEDIERILEHTPTERQTMLFSATLPEGIRRLARRYLRNPIHLKLSPDFVGVAEISHLYYTVSGANREADLLRIVAFENPGRGIVFCNTRDETGRVAEFLRSNGMSAEAISSDLSQSDREKVMKQMREGSLRFLVATDVAARGIDIDDISHVFNFSFPDSPESYIHRTGRTGRAGRTGVAVSLIGPTEVGSFYYLKLLYKIKPEERTLPSEMEIQARREGESLLTLRKHLAKEPGQQWRALARRVLTGLDAEHLLAGLLKQQLTGQAAVAVTSAAPVQHSRSSGREQYEPRAEENNGGSGDRPFTAPEQDSPAQQGRDSRRGRFGADRDRGNERAGRFGERTGRTPNRRGERPERERPERGPRTAADEPVNPESLAAAEHAALIATKSELPRARASVDQPPRRSRTEQAERPERARPRESFPAARDITPARSDDYMSVWSEDDGPPPVRDSAPAISEDNADDGEARLYLNLGRKDRVRADDVAKLLQELGTPVPLNAIDVMNTHSYINVEGPRGEQLVAVLNGHDYNGRTLVCERAKPRRPRY